MWSQDLEHVTGAASPECECRRSSAGGSTAATAEKTSDLER
jgi:hypothetical protein